MINFNINSDLFFNLLKKYPIISFSLIFLFLCLGILLLLSIISFKNDYIKFILLSLFFLSAIFSVFYIGSVILKYIKKLILFVKNIYLFNNRLKNINYLPDEQNKILNTLYLNNGKYKFQSHKKEIKSLVANNFIKPIQNIEESEKLYKIDKRVYKILDKEHNNKIINNLKTLTDNEKKVLELFFQDDYDWIDCNMQNAIITLHSKNLIIHEYDKSIKLNKLTLKNINLISNRPIKKNIVELNSSKMAANTKSGGGSKCNY